MSRGQPYSCTFVLTIPVSEQLLMPGLKWGTALIVLVQGQSLHERVRAARDVDAFLHNVVTARTPPLYRLIGCSLNTAPHQCCEYRLSVSRT
jgi:hypothetical protein